MSSVSSVNSLLSTTPSTVDLSSILAAAVGATTPGIDVSAAVAAALYADRASERGWQAQQVALTNQTTALTAIQTATSALTDDMNSLNTLTGPLSARTVLSSNATEVTATAAMGTVAGVHSIVVGNVASTAGWYSDLEKSSTTTLTTSSFTITNAAGVSVDFPTGAPAGAAGDNLKDLAAAINGTPQLGVTATVVSDSTGSRLAIISNSSGSAASFTVTTPYTGTSWTSPAIPTNDTLGANNITLSSGSGVSLATLTVATTSGETYAQLATAINNAVTAFNNTAAAGTPPTPTLNVTASTSSNASGSTLSIVSSDAAQTPFTINEPSIDTPSFGFVQSSFGVNALLTVDGVPISSATNTVTGAIGGVTLSLLGSGSGAVNLTIASDTNQVATAISQFVSDYNTALGLVNAQFAGSGSGAQGVLGSDPTVRNLQNSLLQVLNYVNTPPTGTTTPVSTLSALGISAGAGGVLTINSATFNSALINNAADVQTFFQGAALNGFADSMNNALSSFSDPSIGAFTVDLHGISNTNKALTQQISDYESIYIAGQQISLTAMYSAAEIALQQLPQQMAQLQAMLGNNTKSGG